MVVAATIKLADARAELGMTQQTLADGAGLTKKVIVHAEKGKPIRRLSAHAILHVLNVGRSQRGMPSLSINELDWRIDGE